EIELLRCESEQAHQMQGFGMAGVDGERLSAALFGRRQLTRLQQAKTRLEVRGRRIAARSALRLGARSRGARSLYTRSLCTRSLAGLFGGVLGWGSSLLAVHRHFFMGPSRNQ